MSKKNREMIDDRLKTISQITAELCWDLKTASKKDIQYFSEAFAALQKVSTEFLSSGVPKVLDDLVQRLGRVSE